MSGPDTPNQAHTDANRSGEVSHLYDWHVYRAARMLAFIHQDCLTHLAEGPTTPTRKWAFQAVLHLLGTNPTPQVIDCLQTMLDAEPDHTLRVWVPSELKEMGMLDRLASSKFTPYATPTPR